MDTYYYIAQVAFKHDDFYDAARTCKNILKKIPDHPEAINLLNKTAGIFPYNLKVIKELKQIYRILGDRNNAKSKISSFDLFKWLFFTLLKVLVYIILFFLFIIIFIATRQFGLIIFIIGYHIYKRFRN